ncbi:MAG: Acetyl-CoA decarbonylase/synthase complex subunit gamma [Methanomassiliicoccales archaeon PtaU1.Bin124]|nr:MAG: Acetyl-CoA decarbonylase/synthase complex subunit gamma [Methanomassiliicoccales archaeon PtaU1.Bin124]
MPTAIEIFKHLPKKNCGECKNPTCLAFAMQLANNKAKLEDCPYVSDAGKAALSASSAPPIRLVKIGSNSRAFEVGDETELYRHEKKFFHPTRYCVEVDDSMSDADIESTIISYNKMKFERVGQIMSLDMIGVRYVSNDPARFAKAVSVASGSTEMPLLVFCHDPAAMKDAVKPIAARRPLVHGADSNNFAEMSAVAKELALPLVVYEDKGLNELADLVAKVKASGVEDIVLDFDPANLKDLLERSTLVRRLSVKRTFRGLGYPILVQAQGDDALQYGLIATMKYGSIVSFDKLKPEHALPLFVLRQNIFTDPQVPIQVKPDLYPVNNPDEKAPIMFTTNFSLTYFTVLADAEKSKIPVWLQVVDTEGLSVLTAYAAGKLTADGVNKALEKSGAKTKSKTGTIIVPGMVARMAAKLQETTGLKAIVGPKESSGLPKFLKGL